MGYVKRMNSSDLNKEYDVIVVGGGPAGLGAAVGAAKLGASTLLLEKNGFFGGIAALGLGMQINHVIINDEPRGGVSGDLVKKLFSYNVGEKIVTSGEYPYKVKPSVPTGYIICNVEHLTMAAFELVEEAGVDYLLHSFVTDVLTDDNRVRGVRISSKSGSLDVYGKAVVDATGDGDIAALSGAQFSKGRDDGFLSPITLLFTAGGIDFAKMRDYQKTDFQFIKILALGKKEGYCVPEKLDPHLRPDEKIVYFNGSGTKGYGNFDGVNVFDLTAAERLSRRHAIETIRLFRDKAVPGFRSSFLVQVASSVAVRETRRIVGKYTLTDEDIKQGTEFPSVVARRYGELDIGFVRLESMVSPHDVPYQCLVPEGVGNLLVAGRCISTSHIAHSAGKSMGNCFETGQAAGVSAAISANSNICPSEISVSLVQQRLIGQGVDLGLARFSSLSEERD